MANDLQPNLGVDEGVPRSREAFSFEDAGKQIAAFIENVQLIGRAITVGLGHVVIYAKRSELLEQSGWLSHPAAPLDFISIDQDASEVSAMLDAHYRDRWADVRVLLSTRVGAYDIDDDAKAAYREALELHGLGHYRAVVRLLFPEIERVACKEIYAGKSSGTASLTELRKVAGDALGLSDFGDVRYSLGLYRRMSRHLYEKVGEDPVSIARYVSDPVPNRHAALHGLVIYRSMKNSMNMLIMADFMFGVIHALKRRLRSPA